MKRIIAILLSFSICVCLCSCTPLSPKDTITHNDDASEIYYNGRTYVLIRNDCYGIDIENMTKIATIPYGFFYLLGAVTIFYGNNGENPDFITENRTDSFYLREDLTLDHTTQLSVSNLDSPYCFTIAEVTTDQALPYVYEEGRHPILCNFIVTFEQYPQISMYLSIHEYDSKLYLQKGWGSDYYEITEDFKSEIYRLGLNTYDDYGLTDAIENKSP